MPACEGALLTWTAAGLGQEGARGPASASWEGLPSEPQAHPVPPHSPSLPPISGPSIPRQHRFLAQAMHAGPQPSFSFCISFLKEVSPPPEVRHLASGDPSLLGWQFLHSPCLLSLTLFPMRTLYLLDGSAGSSVCIFFFFFCLFLPGEGRGKPLVSEQFMYVFIRLLFSQDQDMCAQTPSHVTHRRPIPCRIVSCLLICSVIPADARHLIFSGLLDGGFVCASAGATWVDKRESFV